MSLIEKYWPDQQSLELNIEDLFERLETVRSTNKKHI